MLRREWRTTARHARFFNAVVERVVVAKLGVVSDGALLPAISFTLFLAMLALNFTSRNLGISVRNERYVHNIRNAARLNSVVEVTSHKICASRSQSFCANADERKQIGYCDENN